MTDKNFEQLGQGHELLNGVKITQKQIEILTNVLWRIIDGMEITAENPKTFGLKEGFFLSMRQDDARDLCLALAQIKLLNMPINEVKISNEKITK